MNIINQEPKQVIIIRKDLRNTKGEKVRTGKLIAQACHASLQAVLYSGKIIKTHPHENNLMLSIDITPDMYPDLHAWITGSFTKIVVVVDSEQELVDIYNKAADLNILCSLIEDNGWTEFGGVPTKTAVAIGPANAEVLHNLTGHLKLL